jgi:hypothetical protein
LKVVVMSGEVSMEESASWYARFFNCWITPLLRRGATEVLLPDKIWRASEKHMPPVDDIERLMKEEHHRCALLSHCVCWLIRTFF